MIHSRPASFVTSDMTMVPSEIELGDSVTYRLPLLMKETSVEIILSGWSHQTGPY
jgi:hypothetical protein